MLAGSVTYWNADLVNHGAGTLTACTATLTFVDPYGRTVQIEKENLLDPKEPPLAPNASRHLQIGFDHISFQWNQAPPNVAFTRVYVRKARS